VSDGALSNIAPAYAARVMPMTRLRHEAGWELRGVSRRDPFRPAQRAGSARRDRAQTDSGSQRASAWRESQAAGGRARRLRA